MGFHRCRLSPLPTVLFGKQLCELARFQLLQVPQVSSSSLSLCQTQVENILLQTGLLACATTPRHMIETSFPPLVEVRSRGFLFERGRPISASPQGPMQNALLSCFTAAAAEAVSDTLDSYRGVVQRFTAMQDKFNLTLKCVCFSQRMNSPSSN